MSNFLLRTPHGWYFRIRVPSDLRIMIGKREIKKPLRTHQYKTAIKKARILAVEAHAWFDSLRENSFENDRISIFDKPETNTKLSSGSTYDIFEDTLPRQKRTPSGQEIGPATTANGKRDMPLSKVVELYCDDKCRRKEWRSLKTIKTHRGSLEILPWAFKDAPIGSLSREIDSGTYFFDVLSSIPRDRGKLDYKSKQPNHYIKNPIPEASRISENNINSILDRVKSFWAWAKLNRYTDEGDVFDKLKIPSRKLPHERRDAFTNDELLTLFSCDIYTKKKFTQPFYYWIPLIAALSAMRDNEIAQLEVTDIRQITGFDINGDLFGIDVFDINDNGPQKHIKTKYSARCIPIHQTLIDLGFLRYVSELKKSGCKRIFENLPYSEHNHFGGYVSNRFSHLLKELGIKRDKLSLHSLRHTVTTHLDAHMVPDKVIEALLGHARQGEIATYAKPIKAYTLKKYAIDVIDFSRTLVNIQPW